MENTVSATVTNNNDDTYGQGALITGVIIFAIVWLYAMSQWGFLFGLIFGWIPAIIAAIIGALIWPILLLGIGGIILLLIMLG